MSGLTSLWLALALGGGDGSGAPASGAGAPVSGADSTKPKPKPKPKATPAKPAATQKSAPVQKPSAPKITASHKVMPAPATEATTNADPASKTEASPASDATSKADPAAKVEATATAEPASKADGGGKTDSAGTKTDPAARTEPVATTEHVHVATAGADWSGFVLDPQTDAGYALLTDDGRVEILPLEPAPKIVESTARLVTEIDSAALVAGLGHATDGVRERCEQLLIEQGAAALPQVAEALGARSAEARRRGLVIVTQQTPRFEKAARKSMRRVSACLSDSDEHVRQAALHCYALFGEKDLLKRCTDVLSHDGSELVRHEAIQVLGRLGDPHGIDPLFEHLARCQERSLRLVTFDSLRRITGKGFGRDEDAWTAWWANHRTELLPDERPEPADGETTDDPDAPPDGEGEAPAENGPAGDGASGEETPAAKPATGGGG